eukprot:c17796_g1_i1 orf=370-2274(-)
MPQLSDLAVHAMGSMCEAKIQGRNPIFLGLRCDVRTVLQRRHLELHQTTVWSNRAGFLLEAWRGQGRRCKQGIVIASFDARMADVGMNNAHRMNFNEYMVTLDKPLGIRFVQTLDGKVYVEALVRQGNAHNSQLIMVGDVLKKTSAVFGDAMCDVEDFSCTMHAIKGYNGPVSLVLERPVPPLLVQSLVSRSTEYSFNCGHVAIATWQFNILTSDLQPSRSDSKKEGKVGFSVYTSKFLQPRGLKALARLSRVMHEDINYKDNVNARAANTYSVTSLLEVDMPCEVIASFSDEPGGKVEWTHGDFPIEEYNCSLERAKGDLSYNHSLGMQYTKITMQILVGSCIQTQSDVNTLARNLGITAVLDLRCESEQVNWGIDGEAIERSFYEAGLVVVKCSIRLVDSVDLRRKLPFAVGVLYRLLRKGHCVFVTCTTGLDRSPTCVISYLHWIQDVALSEAVDFVTNLHPCGPDRAAIVWATWDLIAMVEKENHKGPPTHAVQLVWNHGCREGEEVLLVGDFEGWNKPIKALHTSGPNYTANLRLPQGKYSYKFIVGGHWRHSSSLPSEVDKWGNVNNVITVGDKATSNFDSPVCRNIKELTCTKVIERPLTEEERFTLAFAARYMAFSICPITLTPKI